MKGGKSMMYGKKKPMKKMAMKGKKKPMAKAEKAQMKEYFPELYKMQMQMEEDMKNPELERMMKEQEKAIEEMMKGLK